ncbi:MAG: DUF4013 domain-containing protein [Chloroflexota bacterium]
MDFGLAFSYPFQDQDWLKKLGIAGLLMIIPVFGWLVVAGWAIEITRRVIRHDMPLLLPDWNDFGKYIVDGLYLCLIGIIFYIPSFIFSGITSGVSIFAQNQGGGDGNSVIPMIVMVVSICFGCLQFLYGIFLGLVLPAAYANFAVKGNLGAAFAIGEIFGMVKAAIGAYVIVLLGSIVAGFIGLLGMIACFIGVFFTLAYCSLIEAHLWGQAYNQAQAAMGVSNPPEPMANV